ncbi:hypothetical protein DsansV1_C06g0063701 [Dioscorea sansibarensis]
MHTHVWVCIQSAWERDVMAIDFPKPRMLVPPKILGVRHSCQRALSCLVATPPLFLTQTSIPSWSPSLQPASSLLPCC